MILIIGGAYQGKLDFAKNQYGITEEKIYTCTTEEIDFSQQCIYKLEEFTYHHPDPIGYFKANHEQWKDSILICQDIFCGVVPMGAENGPGGRELHGCVSTWQRKRHRSAESSADWSSD